MGELSGIYGNNIKINLREIDNVYWIYLVK
jgi:hypothetical protein